MQVNNKAHKKKDNEDIRSIFNLELCLYIEFMRATSPNAFFTPITAKQKSDKETPSSIDVLCDPQHFLETQITKVRAFTKDGKEIDQPTKTTTPYKVWAYLEHIKIEYIADKEEKLTASEFKWDYKSDDVAEAKKAMQERARAAYNLAYIAKAKGWSTVDFGDTTDPVERYMLMEACERVGIDCSAEKMGLSCVDNVEVEILISPKHPSFREAIKKISTGKKEIDLDHLNDEKQVELVVTLIQMEMNNFITNYDQPFEENGERPSTSPSSSGNQQERPANTKTKPPPSNAAVLNNF